MNTKAFLTISISLVAFNLFATEPIDYSQAMRMGVKFFGGQRCGNTHNWLLIDNTNITVSKTCHLEDKYKGIDLSGGWHDCGDHIKVAHTMGYAAVCLLSAYDIWPTAFEDKHSQTYGAPNGVADVLDEAKVATDFFMKSLNNGEFVYYIGRGGEDHRNWVTSAYQSTLTKSEGGNPRECTATSTGGGWQAMNYASALALMSIHYPNATYATQCLAKAKELYVYAQNHRSTNGVYCDEFYGTGNSNIKDEYALAGAIMYKATGELKYKTDATNEVMGLWESNSPMAWDTVADLMYYYMVKMDPNINNGNQSGTLFSFLVKNTDKIMVNANSYGIPWKWFSSKWGTNKLASGCALSLALYAKLIDDGVVSTNNDKSTEALIQNEKIINYMLGVNEFGHPFIHGFKDDMTYRIHHRNAMGRDDNPPSDVKNTTPFKFACGGLIGGPTEEGKFHNLIEDGTFFMETEGGCDYNAPFVAALANIVARKTPFPTATSILKEQTDLLIYPNPAKGTVQIDINSERSEENGLEIINLKGQLVKTVTNIHNSNTLNINDLKAGIYFIKLKTSTQTITKKLVVL